MASPATQQVGVNAMRNRHGRHHRNTRLAAIHHHLRLKLLAVAPAMATCYCHSFVGIHVFTYELMDTMLLTRTRLNQDGMAACLWYLARSCRSGAVLLRRGQ